MSKPRQTQVMKPVTVAQKLQVYLPATPQVFQEGMITREEFDELQRNPPQWLVELRRSGPHPRDVVAARLRVSKSGLARGGVTAPLTTAQIAALIADPPDWLVRERETFAEVRREERMRSRPSAEPPEPPGRPGRRNTPA